jgi:4-alpha-glucanotransferase
VHLQSSISNGCSVSLLMDSAQLMQPKSLDVALIDIEYGQKVMVGVPKDV